MAAGIKLVLEFYDNENKTVQFSFSDAKQSAGLSNVTNLMDTMIANTQVYAKTLVSRKSAKEVITSENRYDVTETPVTLGNPEHAETDENTAVTTTQIPMT